MKRKGPVRGLFCCAPAAAFAGAAHINFSLTTLADTSNPSFPSRMSAVPNAAHDHHRPSVLVAVADAMAREVVAQMLHVAGFAVLSAATGERALLELRDRRTGIDWLVIGRGLPGLVDAAILSDEFA